ncbi:MAG: PQQ-dependent sugar dehydrogenase [Chloroflexota bacterium]|nr:PQQ-dependent sugar dehydrogenase [Chloroflexota bacterium]
MNHHMPGLGLVARAIVVVSILASCTTAGAGAVTTGAGAGAGAAANAVTRPDVAPKQQSAMTVGDAQPAAVTPASYSVGHLAVTLQRVPNTTYTKPLAIVNAGDGSGRLFIVEQGGRIKIIDGGTLVSTPFLDIHTKISTGSERGLLGLAFHPSYETNGQFYVYYTDTAGVIVIARYNVDPANANRALTNGVTIMRIGHPYSNHNGGTLAFGKDGYLYIGTGDGGSSGDPGNRAQSLSYALGKILRIDVNHTSGSLKYRNPSTNPYVGRSGDDRIWARGLRNPWKFSFDKITGDLWIGDVGQNRYEEIDRATKASGLGRARNYGWRVMEGRACYRPSSGCSTSGKTSPIAVYTHGNGCSVTGGYVYRGTKYPAMTNAYLLSDFCSGRIWALVANGASSQTPRLVYSSGLNISTFGEGEDGTLYVANLTGSGGIYEVVGTAK